MARRRMDRGQAWADMALAAVVVVKWRGRWHGARTASVLAWNRGRSEMAHLAAYSFCAYMNMRAKKTYQRGRLNGRRYDVGAYDRIGISIAA